MCVAIFQKLFLKLIDAVTNNYNCLTDNSSLDFR